MPEHSITVTPQVYTDETTGQTIYDTQNAIIESSAGKAAVNEANNRGEYQTQTIEEGTEVVETITPIDDSDATFLMDSIFGGHDNYIAQLQWAGENLSQEDIEAYDQIVSRGDIAETKNVMEQLKERYEFGQKSQEIGDNFRAYFYDNVCSKENYDLVQQYAADNLESHDIDVMNALIEDAQYSEFEQIIRGLMNRMEAEGYVWIRNAI